MEEVSAFNKFFRLSIHVLAAKIQPDKVARCCQNGDFFAFCIFSEPRAAHFRHAFQIRTKATPCVEVCGHNQVNTLCTLVRGSLPGALVSVS